MTRRAQLIVHLEGALLVGGYTSPTGYLDATTAVDAAGTPMIPASTLKGALREACTRLARGENKGSACTIDAPCKEGACLVCQLFGKPGADTDANLAGAEINQDAPAGLVLRDARPELPRDASVQSALPRSVKVRHGVGIDRRLRSVAPQVLFEREVLDAPDQRFVTSVVADGVGEDAWKLFRAALPLVTGIGNSRSRGLGRIRVELCEEAPTSLGTEHVFPEQAPAEAMVIVEIEALEPLLLGGVPSVSNLLDSLAYVPGSTLRGALGNAAARQRTDAAFHEVFVDPRTCLLFSDAFPAPPGTAELPVPVPRSSLECKHRNRKAHLGAGPARKPVDGLLALALTPFLTSEYGGSVPGHRCPVCDAPLQPARELWPSPTITRRVVTRLARDVHTGSAMPGMLYAVTQIEAGTVLIGTAARVTPRALSSLRALRDVELRLGRGRSRGQGRVKLTLRLNEQNLGARAVQNRIKHYNQAVQGYLPLLRESVPGRMRVGGAIAVLGRSDLAVSPQACPELLLQALFQGDAPRARCVAVQQATGARSGWNEGNNGEKTGPRKLTPVVLAGSVWLFVYEEGVSLDPARLARLEVEGIGEATELGLGKIVINHALLKG